MTEREVWRSRSVWWVGDEFLDVLRSKAESFRRDWDVGGFIYFKVLNLSEIWPREQTFCTNHQNSQLLLNKFRPKRHYRFHSMRLRYTCLFEGLYFVLNRRWNIAQTEKSEKSSAWQFETSWGGWWQTGLSQGLSRRQVVVRPNLLELWRRVTYWSG